MKKDHTSVIYFHGIGTPERHSSLSQFLDYFDVFGQSQKKEDIGRPRDFSYKSELSDEDEVVEYVEFKRVCIIGNKTTAVKRVRIYEAYWSPEADQQFSYLYAFRWIARRFRTPFDMFFSNWRAFGPIKLLSLHRIAMEGQRPIFQRLEKMYRDFDNWDSRSEFPRGSFSDFIAAVRREGGTDGNELERLARTWRLKFLEQSAFMAFVFYSVLLTALSYLLLLLFSVAAIVSEHTEFISTPPPLSPSLAWVVVATSILIIPTLNSVFRTHIYDVLFWTLQKERDPRFGSRRRVLSYARKLIRHVVKQNCSDCIIVSHSLGTSIAMEALLNEGVREQLESVGDGETPLPVEKIRYVFTIGSPIDLIFYLFQSDTSKSHRHSRLEEQRRPSIALPPFWIGGTAGITKVINVWSKFDPLAAPLRSISKSFGERSDAIHDLEVLTPSLPLGAHTNYYRDPRFMRTIYWAVMTGRLPKTDSGDEIHLPPRRIISYIALAMLIVVNALIVFALSGAVSVPLLIFVLLSGLVAAATISYGLARTSAAYVRAFGPFLRR